MISGDCGNVTSDAATLSVITVTLDLNEAGITIVPNPAKDYIHIINNGNKIDKVTLYNTSGKKILEKTKNINHIDLTNIKSGLYFIKIMRGDDVGVGKVIVE